MNPNKILPAIEGLQKVMFMAGYTKATKEVLLYVVSDKSKFTAELKEGLLKLIKEMANNSDIAFEETKAEVYRDRVRS